MADDVQPAALVTKLLELARGDPKYLDDLGQLRHPIVVMFTDIRGSTAFFEKHGDAAGLLFVYECNSMIRRTVEKHAGRVVKTIGDGCMAVFGECGRAIAAAVEMQRSLEETNALQKPEEQTVVRIGLHYGVGIIKSNDVFGNVVNMASRVEAVAMPGQIVISASVYEQIQAIEYETAALGRFSLKGTSGEQSLFEVIWRRESGGTKSSTPSNFPTLVQTKSEPACFKIQLLKNDGCGTEAEYLLESSLTIDAKGKIQASNEPRMPASHAARFTLHEGGVFVESVGEKAVFLRLSAACTLRHGDIIVMGSRAFRFCESSTTGATASELVLLGEASSVPVHYPLHSDAVEFGRKMGAYAFPEDKLMSRIHARILRHGEDFVLEDAGSRNGTFVKLREKSLLPVGSAVLVGDRMLRLIEGYRCSAA